MKSFRCSSTSTSLSLPSEIFRVLQNSNCWCLVPTRSPVNTELFTVTPSFQICLCCSSWICRAAFPSFSLSHAGDPRCLRWRFPHPFSASCRCWEEKIITKHVSEYYYSVSKDPGCYCTFLYWWYLCSLLSSTPGPIPHHLHGSCTCKCRGSHLKLRHIFL